ncbi:chloramphenicol phosphotransferase CPT family protein [Kitasatospora sp. NPDC088134]|uniref:chloramphenicol phosphotransferase CPT family protein n=1 Tax=Kitasatospora sp. NPDC088134 TaxID=3364071 RepID=UPI0038182E42
MTSGRIIFLNGTSSSGKSSIARELLDVLADGVFFHLAVDGFNAMRTKRELGTAELDAALRRTRMGFHRSIAAMAGVGNDIVVDHVLSEPWRLLDCLTVLRPEDVLFVGVHCSPDELARREAARGDRPPGLAAHQYGLVHRHGDYDLECDTSTTSPLECAHRIKEFLPHRPTPTAFTRLRRRLLPDLQEPPTA